MTAAMITWKHACTYILCPLHSLARYFVHIWLPNCLGRMKTSQRTQCGDKYHTCIAGICILIEHILLLVCYLSMYCWVLLKGLRYLHISAGWVGGWWPCTLYVEHRGWIELMCGLLISSWTGGWEEWGQSCHHENDPSLTTIMTGP